MRFLLDVWGWCKTQTLYFAADLFVLVLWWWLVTLLWFGCCRLWLLGIVSLIDVLLVVGGLLVLFWVGCNWKFVVFGLGNCCCLLVLGFVVLDCWLIWFVIVYCLVVFSFVCLVVVLVGMVAVWGLWWYLFWVWLRVYCCFAITCFNCWLLSFDLDGRLFVYNSVVMILIIFWVVWLIFSLWRFMCLVLFIWFTLCLFMLELCLCLELNLVFGLVCWNVVYCWCLGLVVSLHCFAIKVFGIGLVFGCLGGFVVGFDCCFWFWWLFIARFWVCFDRYLCCICLCLISLMMGWDFVIRVGCLLFCG